MNIRKLVPEDIDRSDLTSLANQIRDYYLASGTMIEIDVEKTKASFLNFMKLGFAGVLILEKDGVIVGIIGGFRGPDPLSGKVVANETFWYVDRECRNNGYGAELIRAFEQWAIDEGCCMVRLSHLVDLRSGENKQLYEGSGYKACEVYYEKRIR
jgi:GNAT superfamily N-acetyltransferase